MGNPSWLSAVLLRFGFGVCLAGQHEPAAAGAGEPLVLTAEGSLPTFQWSLPVGASYYYHQRYGKPAPSFALESPRGGSLEIELY